MSFSKTGTYCFGPYTVDLRAHFLMRDGVRLPIQEQPFQILLALLESPGRIVTREDLRRRLWGEETFVDFDQSMNSAVRRLRVALDDNPKAPVFIETVPRIGFRFVAAVEATLPPAPMLQPAPSEQRHQFRLNRLLSHAAPRVQLTVSTAAIFSIAMLLGLSLAARARFAGAKIVQAESLQQQPVINLRQPSIDVSEYPAVLIPASPASYTLKNSPAARAPALPATSNAVELANLEGRYHLSLRNQESYAHANEAFQRALVADPHSTSALVGLAQVHVLLSLEGTETDQHLATAADYANRALRLNPNLASAHSALAAVHVLKDWNWAAGDEAFQQAIALDPSDNLTPLWYAMFVLIPQKQYAQAEQQIHRAIELDPFSLIAQTNLGWLYLKEGRTQAALEQLRLVLRMNPSFVPARFRMAQLLHKAGRHAEAASFEPSDPVASARAQSVAEIHRDAADTCRQITESLAKPAGATLATLQSGLSHHCPAVLYMDQDSGLAKLQQDTHFADLHLPGK